MIDYKKAEQAKKLLDESGVDYVLAYAKENGCTAGQVQGNAAKRNGGKKMSKNLIPEIAKMLGVELGEEFKIKGYEEWFYKFDNDRVLMFKHNDDVKMPVAPVSVYVAFLALLRGECEIIKLPWKSKKGETYYTFELLNGKWIVHLLWWAGSPKWVCLA